MQSFRQYLLNEVFDWVYPIKWTERNRSGDWSAEFKTDAGVKYEIYFQREKLSSGNYYTNLSFSSLKDGTGVIGLTGSGDALAVFSTVMDAVEEYLKLFQPNLLMWWGDGASRAKLYKKIAHSLKRKHVIIRKNYTVYGISGKSRYTTFLLANDADKNLLYECAKENWLSPQDLKEVR